jgi:hypothetical protein
LDKTLWGHICETSSIEILPGKGFYDTGDTEIDYFDIFLLFVDEKEVLEFEIAMDEAVGVTVIHSFDYLLEEYFGTLLI